MVLKVRGYTAMKKYTNQLVKRYLLVKRHLGIFTGILTLVCLWTIMQLMSAGVSMAQENATEAAADSEPAAAAKDEVFPKPDWKDALDPLASPDAVPGGDITFYLAQEPSSLNGYLDSFVHVQLVFGMMYESLLSTNPLSIADEPNLAEKWAISADKKTFTFWIDKHAGWSDGQPITAHDVKATYDAIMASPRTGPTRLFLSRFDSPQVIDSHQISFTAKQVHWNNLSVLGSLTLLVVTNSVDGLASCCKLPQSARGTRYSTTADIPSARGSYGNSNAFPTKRVPDDPVTADRARV
jgi:ABC-type transport system substrate-binding protein